MKKRFYSIGSIIILLIAAVIFVIVPALADSSTGQKSQYPAYGYFNGEAISYQEGTDFYKAVNENVTRYEREGIDLNSSVGARYYNDIFSTAFVNVIGERSLEYFADSTGYIVSDAELSAVYKYLPEFMDETGMFSMAKYNSYSESEKVAIQNRVEKQILRARCYADIFGSFEEVGDTSLYGLKVSSNEVEFLRKMGEKQHAFKIASFNMKNYPKEEVAAFGKNNKDLFVKYNLRVISFDSESKASEALNRLNKKEISFEDAFAEYSKGIYGDNVTGTLSASYNYQLKDAFENPDDLSKVTSLAPDALSKVIKAPSAFCIFQATAAAVQPDFEDDDVIDNVNYYLVTREKSVIEKYFTEKANDFATKASTSDFETAAKFFDVEVTDVEASALNYMSAMTFRYNSYYGKQFLIGNPAFASNSSFWADSTNENLLKAAYALKEGAVSSPVVLSNSDKVVVVTCTEINDRGLSVDDAKKLLIPAVAQESKDSVNQAILANDRIEDNSSAFMAAFNNNKS